MTAKARESVRRWQVGDPPPDLAAVMMARAMAEMFQDEPGRPLPKALAAILRQMDDWEDEAERPAA